MLSILNKIKSLLGKAVNHILPQYLSLSRFTSMIYYVFLSKSFYREFQSVLAGKAQHIKEANYAKENYYLLVRNIHRLEKGLLMRPRRDIFATGYIRETVDSYIRVMQNADNYGSDQLKWFGDVLEEYFSVVGSEKTINSEKARFKKHYNKRYPKESTEKMIPYFRKMQLKSTITFEEFYRLSKQRRSVRWFKDKPVSRDLIDQALKAALQAPSACNRQPFEFKIFDQQEKVQKIANIPMGTKGYSHNIQTIAVVVGNLDAYFSERDRHVIYIDASLASMAFMYALETLGLSSCPINWPDIEEKEKKMSKILGLRLSQRPVMLIAIGYPDEEGMVAFSEKRSLEMIRTYNQ